MGLFKFDAKELRENISNKEWRMRNLYCIRNKQARTVRFNMNKTQEALFESESRFNMTLKGRQQGVSTYYLLDYLDDTMWTDNVNAVILSHNKESIEKLFRIASFAYKRYPEGLRPSLGKGGGSKYEMFFPKLNSRISVSLEVRSDSVSHLHVSEYGLMRNKDRFNASIEAVPADTGRISIESTPFGMNHFHDDWFDPTFPYKKHFFPWYYHYENVIAVHEPLKYTDEEHEFVDKCQKYGFEITQEQIAWRRFKIQSKGRKDFLQEHPEDDVTCFLTSGNCVVDLEMVSAMLKKVPKPIEDNGKIKIWENFIEGEKYVVGADTAEGVGSDYSVAAIYKKRTFEQVAQIRGHLKPKTFAEEINALCERYVSYHNEYPLVAVERNNHGHAVLLWLEEQLEYPNLFEHNDERVGWLTNKLTRPIMIDVLLDGVEDNFVKIKDADTLSELMTLIDNNGKIEAMVGKHDDCVMAHAIAVQMCKEKAHYLEALLTE